MGRLIGAFVGMLLALASPVSAKLVTYDLQGAVFQGGERAGGFITIDTESPPPFENANQSFVFDYMIDVEATQDGTFSSFTYAPAVAVDYSIYFNQPSFGEVFVLQIVSPQTNRVLELWFDETPLSFDGLRSLDLIAGDGGSYSGDRENGPIATLLLERWCRGRQCQSPQYGR